VVKVVQDDGVVLDATFTINPGPPASLLFEAAGGSGGRARNRDYHEGLITLLGRMGHMGLTVAEIRVESSVTAKLLAEDQRVRLNRHRLPLSMAKVTDYRDLKADISTAAREPGARAGAASGGSSRNLRIVFDGGGLADDRIAERLVGDGATDEQRAMAALVDIAAGRRSRGQGFLVSATARRAVEAHAMQLARTELGAEGWSITDVSLQKPCDLECTSADGRELHVEVKGTTTPGGSVIVTPGEVRHALSAHPNTLLFVVHSISLSGQEGEFAATGGAVVRIDGWAEMDAQFTPIAFTYRMGPAT
jgi:Domain of unknown function (DUF3883)